MKAKNSMLVAVFAVAVLAVAVAAAFPLWRKGGDSEGGGVGSGVDVTIEYSDGTSRVIRASNIGGKLSIVDPYTGNPLDISLGKIIDPNTGKQVERVKTEIYVKATWVPSTLRVSDYSVSGTFKTRILKGSTQVYSFGETPFQCLEPKPALVNTVPTVVSSSTVNAEALLGLYSYKVGEIYSLEFSSSPLTLTVIFEDGSVSTKTASVPSYIWEFKIGASGQLTSVSFSFQSTPSSILWLGETSTVAQTLIFSAAAIAAVYFVFKRKVKR